VVRSRWATEIDELRDLVLAGRDYATFNGLSRDFITAPVRPDSALSGLLMIGKTADRKQLRTDLGSPTAILCADVSVEVNLPAQCRPSRRVRPGGKCCSRSTGTLHMFIQ